MKSINSHYNIHVFTPLTQQADEIYEGRFCKGTDRLVTSHTAFSSDGTTAAFDLLDPDPSKLRNLIQQIASEDESTLRAIVAFSHDVVNCFHLSRNGCINALYNILASTSRESSAYLALVAIANVAGNTTDHRPLTANGGLCTLMRALQSFRQSCRIQRAFVTTTMHLAFGPAARPEMASCGMLDALLQLLLTSNGETLLMALTTLKRLATDCHFCKLLLEAGALDRLHAMHGTASSYPREAQECIVKLLMGLQQFAAATVSHPAGVAAQQAVLRA